MTTHRLDIAIVGSGLAGLAAAAVLRKHHNVTVHERGDARIATGGQGIVISPSSVKILESVGFDGTRPAAVPIDVFRVYDISGELLEDVPLGLKQTYGETILAMKRSEFREELLRLACGQVDEGDTMMSPPARLVLSTAVTDLDPEEGRLTLSDGSEVTADVVIVADGIHSRLRSTILGNNDFAAKKTGLTCYRIDIPLHLVQDALNGKEAPGWWASTMSAAGAAASSMNMITDGAGRVVALYPIQDRSWVNFSCLVRTVNSTKDTTESWHADGQLDSVLAQFQGFPAVLCQMLRTATEVKEWELQELDEIPNWVRGRAMLIGDAAHAMTPVQGQGANMAVEDADFLRLLRPGTTREEVGEVLQRAGDVRKHRLAQVSAENRRANAELMSVAERVSRNRDLYYGYKGIEDVVSAQGGEKH